MRQLAIHLLGLEAMVIEAAEVAGLGEDEADHSMMREKEIEKQRIHTVADDVGDEAEERLVGKSSRTL